MVRAGCQQLFDMTPHAAMLLGAVRASLRGAFMLRVSNAFLRRGGIDALVVVDSPVVHLPLAARAKAHGIPVMYYVAPQTWAWGSYRLRKLRRRVDRMAVILPFEEAYFRRHGVDATYVGHPLAEDVAGASVKQSEVDRLRGYGKPVIALLPGSRQHVVKAILPDQLAIGQRLLAAFPGAALGVSVANQHVAPVVEKVTALSTTPVFRHGQHAELIEAADLVLVASGTSTLDVALRGRPMVVMYKSSPVFYHLVGRWLIHTPYLSLPNILAGRQVVPEFMPYYRDIQPIADIATQLLASESAREAMKRDLEEVVAPLREGRASQRAAAMLLELAGQRHSTCGRAEGDQEHTLRGRAPD